jgi:hypothetical protein
MKNKWNDENITKALKQIAKTKTDEIVFERVWFKIEDRLGTPKKGFWSHVVWRPWGHPVRWVVMAAGLSLVLTGTIYHMNGVEDLEMGSYLIHISDPIDAISQDQDVVKVSTLLSEPSSSAPEMSDEVKIDSLASDEIFL